MSREDTPDASRARRPVDARDDWTDPFGAGKCPWQNTAPRRGSVAEARSGCRKPIEPVARSSTNHRVRDFGDNPMTRHRKEPPRKAPFPKDLRRPWATAVSTSRTCPLRRAQVPSWRAFSSGSPGKRPSAPPGCDALGAPSPGGKTFQRRAPAGRRAESAHRCFRRPLRSRVRSELLGFICAARENAIKRRDFCV